mgnify:CR=1 FL=1
MRPTPRTDAYLNSFRDGYGLAVFAGTLERELAEAMDTIKLFADCVESLAFEMEPPNKFSPRFVQMAIEARAAIAKATGE